MLALNRSQRGGGGSHPSGFGGKRDHSGPRTSLENNDASAVACADDICSGVSVAANAPAVNGAVRTDAATALDGAEVVAALFVDPAHPAVVMAKVAASNNRDGRFGGLAKPIDYSIAVVGSESDPVVPCGILVVRLGSIGSMDGIAAQPSWLPQRGS